MTDWTVSQDIEGRLISDASEVVPGVDDLRAVDVVGRFAALFRFGVGQGGRWSADCTIAERISPGIWQERGSGGSIGAGCHPPFRPSRQLFGGHSLSIWGSAGSELLRDPDDEETMVLVRGLYGFATPEVRGVRVRSGGTERTLAIESPAGAFVVVILGWGGTELQGTDDRGTEVGPPESDPPQRGRRLGGAAVVEAASSVNRPGPQR
ncbi:MAG TPA: hypothetical protein VHB02_02385 [Acidimicrobiales bacterium]|nr:hypothetical protein [Acidimicrobiales bacterium]